LTSTSAGKPEQKLEWAFQMYDVNGDGTIEPSEMAEIIGVRRPTVHFHEVAWRATLNYYEKYPPKKDFWQYFPND